MTWINCIQRAIQAMETHLTEEDVIAQAARAAMLSPFYLERGFKMMCGFSLGEYVRNRRLYQAALEVLSGEERIIDIAFRYGYETPESFSKAFARFHGLSPLQLKKEPRRIRLFLPLKIQITIQGGNDMNFTVEEKPAFTVIGYERKFHFDTSYQEIPRFWDNVYAEKVLPLQKKGTADTDEERAIKQNAIGEYGVCVDDGAENGHFSYFIAGEFQGGDIPAGMQTYDFPALTWAVFPCRGPLPGALQSVNTKIFQEWLPNNPDYEIAYGANIEWYSDQGMPQDADYQSAIWIPVKKK